MNRAEQLVKELVREGEIQREAASGLVRDLMERTRGDREEVARALRVEIQNQTAQLGIASAREVERLERMVDRLTDRVARLEARSESHSKSTGPKATHKKAIRKKTTRKKATRKGSTPRKRSAGRTASGRKPASGGSRGS